MSISYTMFKFAVCLLGSASGALTCKGVKESNDRAHVEKRKKDFELSYQNCKGKKQTQCQQRKKEKFEKLKKAYPNQNIKSDIIKE